MKSNRIFAAMFILFFAFGCSQPMATSLLTNESTVSDGDDTTDTGSTEGQIEISADNTELTVSVDDSDKVEVTGKCTDLDRRKNRILVEVFAGEDETATPYISNGINDFCQNNSSGIFPGATPSDICFWVTKGIGIIEPSPVNRSFPQCHDGVFGFAVKLGKILNSTTPPQKYTIRFKMRTLDGILADTPWSRVSVTRTLNNPSIDKVSANDTEYSCLVESSPARFNQDISYMLTKTGIGRDLSGGQVNFGNVFGVRMNTSVVSSNFSVFSWKDQGAGKAIIAGATYTYTMDSSHDTVYTPAYTTIPTAISNSLTCTIANPQIYMSVQPIPGLGTCYLASSGTRVNPQLNSDVQIEWAVGPASGWTGPDGTAAAGAAVPGCGSSTVCTASGLAPNVQYYFAMREIYVGVPNLVGKWSNEVQCIPPP